MQGVAEEDIPNPSLAERLTKLHRERPPLAEFTNLATASLPFTAGVAVEKVKLNIRKFLYYYLMFFLLTDLFFLFFRRLIIIPIVLTVAFAIAAAEPLAVNEYKLEPLHAVALCMGMHVIMCLLFRKMAVCYVYFFALNAFSAGIVTLHACIIDPEDKSSPENAV